MDVLRAELARRKQAVEALKSEVIGSEKAEKEGTVKRKRFIRRGELERIEEQRRLEAEAHWKAEREAKRRRRDDRGEKLSGEEFDALSPRSKEKRKQEAAAKAAAHAHGGGEEDKEDDAADYVLPREEVIRRLREMGLEATFFGETDDERLSRLRRHESEAHAIDTTLTVADRNALLDTGKDERRDDSDGEDVVAKERAKIRDPHHESDDEMFVYRFFKNALREWAIELASRPETVKRTVQGKVQTKTHKQCKDYMRPFFKMCRKKTVSSAVLVRCKAMVEFALQRDYRKAHDEYLQLAIGNSPWPIGVTSVGIHQRTAREKIQSNNVAHVMNDEMQRKYVTSFKRLLTFWQRKYPTDPSRMVM